MTGGEIGGLLVIGWITGLWMGAGWVRTFMRNRRLDRIEQQTAETAEILRRAEERSRERSQL